MSHELLINPKFDPIKQNMQKLKLNLFLRINEEVTKKIQSKVVEVTKYLMWLDNIIMVPKKDDKIKICVEYRDLYEDIPISTIQQPDPHILLHES